MVVDAHVHFWDPAALHYPWLGDIPALRHAFLPKDYAPLADRSVDAVVFVEGNCHPARSDEEVHFVEELAAAEPRIAGAVAYLDILNEESMNTSLTRLRAVRRVIGVRHNIQGHAAGFALQPAFVRGVAEVGRAGFTFDLCVTADQLVDVERLVTWCPDTSFVLDHCGKPAIRDDEFDVWARDLARLAAHANVSCKLSGLFSEARADQMSDDALFPYAEHALACFGPARLLYGSDWPVCTLRESASTWQAFTDRFTAGWESRDRQDFYAGNAIRLYRLNLNELS